MALSFVACEYDDNFNTAIRIHRSIPFITMTDMASPLQPHWPVAVFAHNEAAHITRCLNGLRAAADDHPLQVYVLANGCSDATEDLVRHYAESHPEVQLVSITMGDKSNAWNHYVHEVASPSPVHFFIDGDVRICPGAFRALAACLKANPALNSAAGVPYSGRSAQSQIIHMTHNSYLAGNLYALSGRFIDRVREQRVRLPIGFIGEDGLVGQLSLWDLDPKGPSRDELNQVCLNAGFEFDPLSLLRWADIKQQYQRMVRYSLRRYQFQMLGPMLKTSGIGAMPENVDELYRRATVNCHLDRLGPETPFDWLALRLINRADRPMPK